MHNKLFLVLAIIWTSIITYLSLVSSISIGNTIEIPYKDKMVHFVFYFLFVILWVKATNYFPFVIKKGIQILIIAIAFGIIMEICQAVFTTTRTADVFDALANTIGATVGFFIIKWNKSNEKTSH